MADEVLLERDGAVAILTLNRPGKLNAVNLDVLALLREHLVTIRGDLRLRVVVVRGSGRAFCAGADLDSIGEFLAEPEQFAAFMAEWHATYNALAEFELPTVAAVHGMALAGGFELMQVCDLVVAARSARLGDQHASYGLFPGGGSSQRLPRQIGVRQATWLLLSGEWIDGSRAAEIGLVNEAVDDDAVLERALEMARTLTQRSPAASAAIKRAVAVGAGRPLDEALALDLPIALEHMGSQDAQIGLAAFRARIEPSWERH
jgi:enoyl-CoA hydratase/carnithine racemase